MFLFSLSGISRGQSGCSACEDGEVTVEFCADASLIKGPVGAVSITLGNTLASAPNEDPAQRKYEPENGTGGAGTNWGKVKLKKGVPVSGTLNITPGGTSGDYTGEQVCLGAKLTCQFRFSCADDLVFEFHSSVGDVDGKSGWRELRQATFNYFIPSGIPNEIPIMIRLREKDGSGGEDATEDGSGEESSASPPSIPSGALGSGPDGNGEPQDVNQAGVSSSISLRGAEGEEFYAGILDLTGLMSPSLPSLANLEVRHPDGNIDSPPHFDVVSPAGVPRQVKTEAALYDIVSLAGGGFEVRTYEAGTFGTVPDGNGIYAVNSGATPSSTVKYTPVASAGDHQGGLKITRTSKGGTVSTKEFLSTSSDGTSWREIRDGIEIRDHLTTFQHNGGKWYQYEQETVMRDNVLYSKIVRSFVYQVQFEGSPATVVGSHLFQLSETVYDAETTTLQTVWEPDPEFPGKPAWVLRPDGSWTAYRYYDGSEAGATMGMHGLTKEILRPWGGNIALPAAATTANSESTVLRYDLASGDETEGYELISEETTLPVVGTVRKWEKITGSAPQSTFFDLLETAGLDWLWRGVSDGNTRDDSRKVYTSASDFIPEVSLTYDTAGTPGEPWDGETFATLDAEGNGTIVGFERGDFNATTGAFVPDPDPWAAEGDYIRSISTEVEGSDFAPLGQSTREITIRELKGRELRREFWVRTGASSWSLATTTTFEHEEWPDGSLKETITKQDGRIVSRLLQVSGTEQSEWDEQGIETRTVRDGIGRPVSVTTVGAAASGTSPAQPDRVTSYGYSGRTTSITRSAVGSTAIVETSVSDLAGRPIELSDASGAVTITSYPNGGRDILVTLPGGPTRLTTGRIDGRTASVTGTAVVDEVYEYEALTGGNVRTTLRTGDLPASPRYSREVTDWAGRTVTRVTPSPEGSGEVTLTHTYAGTATPNQVTRRPASISSSAANDPVMLYQRVAGVTYSGHDAGSDGLLPASNDRVTETRGYYTLEGGYWWAVSYRKQYDQDGSDASAVSTVTKTCLHGQPDGVAEKSVRIAPTGETITAAVSYDRATKTRVTTESTSGVTTTAVETDVNGLVLSRKGYDTTAATAFYYDSLGRPYREDSPRGEITERSYYADGSLKSVKDHAGKSTVYSYYGPTHASAGKLASVTNPEGKTITYAYDDLGNITEEAGTATYKVTYQYDEYGARWKMFTWRDATTSDITEWIYQDGTGLLQAKKDAANQSVTYTYHASGKVATRTWARGVTSTYSYNGFGDLTGIDYSDATPDVTFANHDRLGRPRTVTQTGLGSEVLGYLPGKPGLQSRYYAGATGSGLTIHKLLPGRGIRYSAPDGAGRSSGFLETASTTSSSYSTSRTLAYAYDGAGRLETITDGSQSVAYAYHSDSSLISTVQNKTSGTAWFEERRYYDTPGRLTGIRSRRLGSSTAELTTYAYDYDSLGRRTKSTFQDGSHWEYGYNDRSEVTSATRRNASGTEVSPLSASYSYDGIGNRLSSTSGVLGNHGYTPNSLNQYATVTTGNSRSAVGRADSGWEILVEGAVASKIGEIYHKALTVSNSAAPVWQSVLTQESGGASPSTRFFWHAKSSTAPAYDADGNLLSDGRNGSTDEGRWVYTWDAENRLIKMETTAAAVTAGMSYTKLVFEYDYEGKRIARHVWRGGSSGSPVFLNSRRWLYEGWNPVAEFTGTSDTAATGATDTALNRYTWGLDLGDAGEGIAKPGQMLQRAGGVGGLVLQTTVSGGVMERPSYDGNGNIVAWTKSTASVPTSRREYDAFGNVVMSEGASPSGFGFSTKIEDAQTGLLYYGYRYYQPEHGRWISRDPIQERGGLNLSQILLNNPVNQWDYLGLAGDTVDWPDKPGPGASDQEWEDFKSQVRDIFDDLAKEIGDKKAREKVEKKCPCLKPKNKLKPENLGKKAAGAASNMSDLLEVINYLEAAGAAAAAGKCIAAERAFVACICDPPRHDPDCEKAHAAKVTICEIAGKIAEGLL